MVGVDSKCHTKTRPQSLQWSMYFYILWDLWKEKNRKTFENEYRTVQQVAPLTKEDKVQRHRAVAVAGEAN